MKTFSKEDIGFMAGRFDEDFFRRSGRAKTWESIEKTLSGIEVPDLEIINQEPDPRLRAIASAAETAINSAINGIKNIAFKTGHMLSEVGSYLSGVQQYAVNGGIGASVAGRRGAYIVSLNDETEYQHAWYVTAWYNKGSDEKEAGWELSIKPGFCNGIDPAIYAQRANGYNPFSVYKTFTSGLGASGGAASESGGVNALFTTPLGETNAADWIELSRGPVSKVQGFANDQRLPEFFARQNGYNPNVDLASGAESTAQLLAQLGFQITNNGVTQDLTSGSRAENARQVVAQDFWLEVPRAAYRTTVDIIANPLTGQLVDYNTVFDTGVLDQRQGQVRIYQGKVPQGRDVEGVLSARILSGDLDPSDPGVDMIPLFTFYLMQPPVASRPKDDDGKPNGSWAPFVQYHTTWNVNHGVRNSPPININASAPIELTTAFFVGRFTLAAGALGAVTAEFDRILNTAMNNINSGRLWTS
jgi:hypothetical protein